VSLSVRASLPHVDGVVVVGARQSAKLMCKYHAKRRTGGMGRENEESKVKRRSRKDKPTHSDSNSESQRRRPNDAESATETS